MIIRIRGMVLAFAAVFLWGTVNTSHRPPESLPLWAFGSMLGVLVLAVGHQILSLRPKDKDQSFMIGLLTVSALLSVTIAVLAVVVGLIVERSLAATGTGWGDSAARAAWHGMAVLAFGVAVSTPAVSSTPSDERAKPSV
ncbi:MAG: hypothetical protein K2X32_12665 [Phycisphaerales bacterium]|nr:hypothetical protein [Phycisphaerales bacterium]